MEQHSSSHQWPQGVGLVDNSSMSKNKPSMELEEANRNTNPNISNTNQGSNTKKTANKGGKSEQGGGGGGAMSCPRCSSLNTKFCYFNNYSLSQPRHFCKTCRRYWTQGGSLRSVPVGGGSRRKNTATNNNNRQPQQPPPPPSTSSSMFPPIAAFPSHQNSPRFVLDDLNLSYPQPIAPDSGPGGSNANDRSKGLSSMMMMGSSFMRDLGFSSSPPGFHSTLLDFKPAATSGGAAAPSSPLLNFSVARDDGNIDDAGFGGFRLGLLQEGREARISFPAKQDMTSNTGAATDDQGDRSGTGAGFWNHGLLLGGSGPWFPGNHQIQ